MEAGCCLMSAGVLVFVFDGFQVGPRKSPSRTRAGLAVHAPGTHYVHTAPP